MSAFSQPKTFKAIIPGRGNNIAASGQTNPGNTITVMTFAVTGNALNLHQVSLSCRMDTALTVYVDGERQGTVFSNVSEQNPFYPWALPVSGNAGAIVELKLYAEPYNPPTDYHVFLQTAEF